MKRLLFPCALILLFASTNQAQQPPAKPDPSAAKTADKPKRKLDADLSGFDVSDDKSNKQVSTMLGGSRTAAIPSATLLAPKRAKFYGASALFPWTFAGHNEGYVIIVTDEDETQLIHQQVKEPHYLFDPAKAKLRPGETYYWRVQVLPNPLASEPLEFVIVSAEEHQDIDNEIAAIPSGDPYQAAFARARVFADHRLWFDALGAYTDLIAKYPNNPEPYEDRGAIYAQISTTKSLSEADLATAARLSKGKTP
jgi:hypothetical protein